MILLDTDIMIDLSRKYPPAIAWLGSLGDEEIINNKTTPKPSLDPPARGLHKTAQMKTSGHSPISQLLKAGNLLSRESA